MIFKKAVTIMTFFWFGTQYVYAQPIVSSVSGAFFHKGAVTISGSNFGTKSPAAPLMWEDSESHASNVDDNTYLASQLHDPWPSADDCTDWRLMFKNTSSNRWPGAPHGRSRIIIGGGHKDNYPDNQNCREVGFTVDAGSPQNSWLLIWYERKSPDFPTSAPPEGWLYNQKAAPFQTGSAIYSGEICQMWGLNSPSGVNSSWIAARCGQCDGTLGTGSAVIPSLRDKWVHLEIRFKNDVGLFKTIGDNLISMDATCSQSEIPIFGTPARSWSIGGFFRWYYPRGTSTGVYHGSHDAWRFFDDIYVDNTLSRVILANSSDYVDATIIEPQIPYAWSSTSITIIVNQGALPTGETSYLFVFDADDNHNSVGFPITFPEGPPPTSGFRVGQ